MTCTTFISDSFGIVLITKFKNDEKTKFEEKLSVRKKNSFKLERKRSDRRRIVGKFRLHKNE